MSTNVTFNGTTYAIPAAGELNWSALSAFLIDVGNNAGLSSTNIKTIRVATTSPVTVAAASDYCIVTNLTVAGAVTVNLPAGVNGQVFVIVDGKGDAATNNVTISPNGAQTINGAASFVINKNRQAVMLQYSTTGTNWSVTTAYIPVGTITNSDISASAAIAGTKIAPAFGTQDVTNSGKVTVTATAAGDAVRVYNTSTSNRVASLELDSNGYGICNLADGSGNKKVVLKAAGVSGTKQGTFLEAKGGSTSIAANSSATYVLPDSTSNSMGFFVVSQVTGSGACAIGIYGGGYTNGISIISSPSAGGLTWVSGSTTADTNFGIGFNNASNTFTLYNGVESTQAFNLMVFGGGNA